MTDLHDKALALADVLEKQSETVFDSTGVWRNILAAAFLLRELAKAAKAVEAVKKLRKLTREDGGEIKDSTYYCGRQDGHNACLDDVATAIENEMALDLKERIMK